MGCASCKNRHATRLCGHCKTVEWCSEKCQSEHWEKHKIACEGSRKAKPPRTLIPCVWLVYATAPPTTFGTILQENWQNKDPVWHDIPLTHTIRFPLRYAQLDPSRPGLEDEPFNNVLSILQTCLDTGSDKFMLRPQLLRGTVCFIRDDGKNLRVQHMKLLQMFVDSAVALAEECPTMEEVETAMKKTFRKEVFQRLWFDVRKKEGWERVESPFEDELRAARGDDTFLPPGAMPMPQPVPKSKPPASPRRVQPMNPPPNRTLAQQMQDGIRMQQQIMQRIAQQQTVPSSNGMFAGYNLQLPLQTQQRAMQQQLMQQHAVQNDPCGLYLGQPAYPGTMPTGAPRQPPGILYAPPIVGHYHPQGLQPRQNYFQGPYLGPYHGQPAVSNPPPHSSGAMYAPPYNPFYQQSGAQPAIGNIHPRSSGAMYAPPHDPFYQQSGAQPAIGNPHPQSSRGLYAPPHVPSYQQSGQQPQQDRYQGLPPSANNDSRPSIGKLLSRGLTRQSSGATRNSTVKTMNEPSEQTVQDHSPRSSPCAYRPTIGDLLNKYRRPKPQDVTQTPTADSLDQPDPQARQDRDNGSARPPRSRPFIGDLLSRRPTPQPSRSTRHTQTAGALYQPDEQPRQDHS